MDKQPNLFSRKLIVILFVSIIVLIVITFVWGNSRFSITNEMILLIALLVFLALAEVFDNFNIANLIMAQKEKQKVDTELKTVKDENRELRSQIIGIVSNSVNSRNTNIIGFSKSDLVQVMGTEGLKENDDSDPEAIDDSVVETAEINPIETREYSTDRQSARMARLSAIKQAAIDHFIEQNAISKLSVMRNVQFSKEFIVMDPIMERQASFDAYCRVRQEETFIVVKQLSTITPTTESSLYYTLSKVYYYRQAGHSDAKVVLLIAVTPDLYKKKPQYMMTNDQLAVQLQKRFSPAIMNGLLEIATIEITSHEITEIERRVALDKNIRGETSYERKQQ